MPKVFNDLVQGLQEIAEFEQGKRTLRVDNVEIIPLERFSAAEIRSLRMGLEMSQMVFALILGVSEKTIESWEAGINRPNGASSRLMQLIQKEPGITRRLFSRKVLAHQAYTP